MKAMALALVLAAVPYTVSAADPFVGTYRLNATNPRRREARCPRN